jgi:hypothetical protein
MIKKKAHHDMALLTKNGRALQVSGDLVYSRSGKVVGRINGQKVSGANGRYVGTIINDRLVHRSTDNAVIGSSSSGANRTGFAMANRAVLQFEVMNQIFKINDFQ